MKIIKNLIDHCDFRTITKGGLFIYADGKVYAKIEPVCMANSVSLPNPKFNAVEVGGGCMTWIDDDEHVIEIIEIVLK